MFDYDIQEKKELDALMRKMLRSPVDAGGECPTIITVSPEFHRKLERTFPSDFQGTFKFDDIPIKLDQTLAGEQIIMHRWPQDIVSTE